MFDRASDDPSIYKAMELRHRDISREQMERFEGYIAEIFAAFGLDLKTSATEETPRRFLQAVFEATEGYDGDPKVLKVFDTECRGEPDCRLVLRSSLAIVLKGSSKQVSTTLQANSFSSVPMRNAALDGIREQGNKKREATV